MLHRLLGGIDSVLVARTEQNYHETTSRSDVMLTLAGGGHRHLDISIKDTASVFFNKSLPSDAHNAHSSLSHIFDDIANDGVQRVLQTRFQSKVNQYRTILNIHNITDAAGPPLTEFDVAWDLGDLRPIIFDATGTLHVSSQKWLKGMLGDEKWATFIAEASEIFAISYGGILRTVTRSWAQSELGSDLSDDMETLVAW